MSNESFEDRDTRLRRLLTQITSLTDTLRSIEEGGPGDYLETYKTLGKLRERYRQETGLYPMLSPSWRAPENSYQHFIELLQAFIVGQRRSRDDVRALETEFAKHFDNDDRFADLQYELAMYDAEGGSSDASVTRECEWALKLLLGEMW